MKEYDLVASFNQVILDIPSRKRGLQEEQEAELSRQQLIEEANEFLEANDSDDYIGAIDACIDSIVFAMGILYKMGIDTETYEVVFEAVMNANMEKKLGTPSSREGFGDTADAVKPEGWLPPEDRIAEIMNA